MKVLKKFKIFGEVQPVGRELSVEILLGLAAITINHGPFGLIEVGLLKELVLKGYIEDKIDEQMMVDLCLGE